MKRLWIVAVAAAHLGVLNADTDRPQSTDGNRFLFVVETSATSARLDHGGRQALVDLIYTGVYGQMRTGDTFGLWAFNDQVSAGVYPMQTWNNENTMELASNAGQFLKAQHYHKKGRFDLVVQEVLNLVRGVKDVNVFIISDSETRPPVDAFGPAFDREYAENVTRLPNSKTPLITTVVGRNGSISNWFVTVGGEPIRLPAFAVPPHLAPKPAVSPTLAKIEAVRSRRSPIIMKGAASAPRGNDADSPPELGHVISGSAQISYVSSVRTNAPPAATSSPARTTPAADPKLASISPPPAEPPGAAVSESNPAKNPDQTPSLSSPRQSALFKSDSEKQAIAKTAAPAQQNATIQQAAKTVPTPVPAPKASELQVSATSPAALVTPEPIKVAARERTSSSVGRDVPIVPVAHPTAMAATVEPTLTDQLFSPAAMVVIGGLLLVLAASLGILLLQRMRRPAQASFITQSLERQ